MIMLRGRGWWAALIGSIPALLKVYFHTNELVTSLMFNYVFFYLGIYNGHQSSLQTGRPEPLRPKKYQPTASLGKPHQRNELPRRISHRHCSGDPVIPSWYTRRSSDMRSRISGSNPEFAKYSGIRTSRVIILTQVIAGAVAGLGGSVEQMAMYQRFNWQDSTVLRLGRRDHRHPFRQITRRMVPLAAFFLAYIRVGADLMSRRSDVQNELVSIIQAVLILFVTAERFMAGWKQRQEAKKALGGEA